MCVCVCVFVCVMDFDIAKFVVYVTDQAAYTVACVVGDKGMSIKWLIYE